MAIDNRIEKVRGIADEENDELLAALIPLGAVFSPVLAVIAALKSVVDGVQATDRVRKCIGALCDELQSMQDRLPHDADSAMNAPWFKRAVQVLIEESSRARDSEHAMKLGRVAAHGCFPDAENKHRQEDLATYIRDLATLGTDDIQMLRLLCEVHEEGIRVTPNMHDPAYFTKNFDKFKGKAQSLGIHEDDRISLGARLSGFGLAYETARAPTTQSPGEHCFRPTRRGVYLLSLLQAAEVPKDKQN
jgi:hypothetical protein